MKTKVEKIFGKYVLNDETLKKFLPSRVYKEYSQTKLEMKPLSKNCAHHIAIAIKKWAFKMGATRYTHWFMPLNNKTAEKQVSFIEINSKGKVLEDFSESALIKGEADASSFPNGGERMTFEARGYTVWDYTSPIFIKEYSSDNKVVFIPTAFCSYNGTALDEKTPLLRASQALNNETLKLLKKLNVSGVLKTEFNVGAEQEYFLIDKSMFENRFDLKTTGRTLIGAKPLKSQEENSHYFGKIEERISKFMNDVNKKLWKMGITAKLQHNEVAPCQFEFVPIFNCVNIANDQNQLIMETLSDTAKNYNLVALFHEKPFNYINGSGKHENWSITTNNGINLFDVKAKDNLLFATFFVSMVCAIDKYYPILRQSTAYYSNDFRLGGNEAPPALISIYTSDFLLEYVKAVLSNKATSPEKYFLKTGVSFLPSAEKDYCDRNRTSPFAFTGNKFEFRMPGSSQSVAWPSTCVCTILCDVISELNEKLKDSTNPREDIKPILSSMLEKHSRIIYNGNGYDKEWLNIAKKRGLIEYKNGISTFNVLSDENTIKVFEKHNILSKNELLIRKSNTIKTYYENLLLDAKTLTYMFNKDIFPALNTFAEKDKQNLITKDLMFLKNKLSTLTKIIGEFESLSEDEKLKSASKISGTILAIRTEYDNIENLIPKKYMPFPDYNEVLF